MLRREPTSVTLTPKDIEMFKELVREQQYKKEIQQLDNAVPNEDSDNDRDDIFMGRSITQVNSKKRDLHVRLGSEDEEEDEDIEGPLFKKLQL